MSFLEAISAVIASIICPCIVKVYCGVGHKNKLLILSEYVNKTEKIGGT